MTSPWPNPPQLPTGPRADDDPTGIRYDRTDLDDQQETHQAGARRRRGFRPTGRRTSADVFTVQLKPCCGLLPGDVCGCAESAAELAAAPVVVMRPFDLRALAEQHVTAAEVDRRERGAL